MAAMTNNDDRRPIYFKSYFKSDHRVGSEAYYAEAMSYGFYGVEDDGRSFKVSSH